MIGTLVTMATEVIATEGVSRVMYQIVKATGPKWVPKSTRIWTKVGVSAISTVVGTAAAKSVRETINEISNVKDDLKLRETVQDYGTKKKAEQG